MTTTEGGGSITEARLRVIFFQFRFGSSFVFLSVWVWLCSKFFGPITHSVTIGLGLRESFFSSAWFFPTQKNLFFFTFKHFSDSIFWTNIYIFLNIPEFRIQFSFLVLIFYVMILQFENFNINKTQMIIKKNNRILDSKIYWIFFPEKYKSFWKKKLFQNINRFTIPMKHLMLFFLLYP
jgi:hypothetical protein